MGGHDKEIVSRCSQTLKWVLREVHLSLRAGDGHRFFRDASVCSVSKKIKKEPRAERLAMSFSRSSSVDRRMR